MLNCNMKWSIFRDIHLLVNVKYFMMQCIANFVNITLLSKLPYMKQNITIFIKFVIVIGVLILQISTILEYISIRIDSYDFIHYLGRIAHNCIMQCIISLIANLIQITSFFIEVVKDLQAIHSNCQKYRSEALLSLHLFNLIKSNGK